MSPRRFPWPLRWWATVYLVPRTPRWLAPGPSIHPLGGPPGGPPAALARLFLPRNSSPLLRDPARSSAAPPKTPCAVLPAASPARTPHASPLPRTPWRGTTPRSTASPTPATPPALPETSPSSRSATPAPLPRRSQVRSRLAASCSFENTRWKYLSCGWLTAVSAVPPSACSAARSPAMRPGGERIRAPSSVSMAAPDALGMANGVRSVLRTRYRVSRLACLGSLPCVAGIPPRVAGPAPRRTTLSTELGSDTRVNRR